jgi:hypothetical protein
MNKLKTLLFLSLVLFLGSTFSSCNKYEDGPGFSLTTAKKRLSRDWNLTSLTQDGENVNLQGITHFVSFDKSGSYTQTLTVQSAWGPITTIENGTWAFSADKKFVNLTKNSDNSTNAFRLLELRKTQFKVKSTEDNKEIIRTFAAK